MCERIFNMEGWKLKFKPGDKGWRFWKYGQKDVKIKGAFDHQVLEYVLEIIARHTASCQTADDARRILLKNDGGSYDCKVYVGHTPDNRNRSQTDRK